MIGEAVDRPRDGARCGWCHAPLDITRDEPVVRCGRCGVGTTHPWPDDAALDAAYAQWYRPESGRFSFVGDAVLRRTRGRLAGRVDRISPAGAVLDIGSGDGTLVAALRRHGRVADGLERVDAADDDPMGGRGAGEFAAVVLWHSLEHLRTPTQTLEAVRDALAPEGVLVVAVPNYASLQARVFGRRWFALDVPRHLVHIPAAALVAQLRTLGFTVERTSYLRGGQVVFGWLDGLVGSIDRRLNLYDAIRRRDAREHVIGPVARVAAVAAAVALAPVAAVAGLLEAALRRGGTFYVEARLSDGEGGVARAG